MIRKKQIAGMVAAGSLAGLLAFSALAPLVAYAQDDPGGAPTARFRMSGNWAERIAEQLGVSEEDLQSAIESVAAQVVDQAVEDEVLTEDEGDELLESLSEAIAEDELGRSSALRELLRTVNRIDFDVKAALSEALDIDLSDFDDITLLGGGFSRGMPDQEGEDRPGMGGEGRPEVNGEDRAEADEEERPEMNEEFAAQREALEALQPYLESDDFQEAIQSAYEAAIDEAVADGALTEEQAETLKEDGSFPGFGMGGGFGGRGGGGAPGGMDRGGMGPGPRGNMPHQGGAPNSDGD